MKHYFKSDQALTYVKNRQIFGANPTKLDIFSAE